MRSLFTSLFMALITFQSCKSQPVAALANNNDMEAINSIFDRVEIQGLDTKQSLLYGYFFYDKDKAKLEKLKAELVKQSYRFVTIDPRENEEYMLHVEKIQRHTRKSLFETEQQLRALAKQYNVASFDGFDVGNPDPAKPLLTNESFLQYMNSKKGNDLFALGIKLYDLEINDRAATVFETCIQQKIYPDTASFKLGNILIRQNKIDEGISRLDQATKFNPNYTNAFFNLGSTCYDNRKYQKSIEYYQAADKLKPNDDNIIYGIAASQYAIQQFDKSLENCRRALSINNRNQNAKILMEMLKDKVN